MSDNNKVLDVWADAQADLHILIFIHDLKITIVMAWCFFSYAAN